MKKTFLSLGAGVVLLLSTAVSAQQTNTPPPTQSSTESTEVKRDIWDPQNNPTVAAISAKYKDKMIAPKSALTTEDIFPAIGNYESVSNPEATMVNIRLDEENKGLIWIEGLPQGTIKAMLRKSPATYKIPAQQTADGKDVAEGTLIFDKERNALSISIGKEFNAADPAAAFLVATEEEAPVTTTKSKSSKTKKVKEAKPWVYTGSKIVKEESADADMKVTPATSELK